MNNESTTTPATAEALEFRLRLAGFVPGAPPHVTWEARKIDAAACRQLKCPGCGKRRCVYRPFTDGARYRVLACCRGCGAAEEM
jgi:hypothetical protein